jgi:hypothetical protein
VSPVKAGDVRSYDSPRSGYLNGYPCPSLLAPARVPGHVVERSLGERLLAIDGLKVEDLLLDVGGEQGQVEQLRQPPAGEAELGGECV